MKAFLFCWILMLQAAWPLCAGKPPKGPRQPLDLNTATATELMQLPRVGARTAARILDHRKAHGPFQHLEELMHVQGIGEKAFDRLRPHLRLGAAR